MSPDRLPVAGRESDEGPKKGHYGPRKVGHSGNERDLEGNLGLAEVACLSDSELYEAAYAVLDLHSSSVGPPKGHCALLSAVSLLIESDLRY